MIVPRVFKSRQRKRKNISIVLPSHQAELGRILRSGFGFFFCLTACADIGYLFCQRFSSKKEIDI